MLAGRCSVWFGAVLLLVSRLPLFCATSSAAPGSTGSVALGWNPSPDTNAIGYRLLFGAISGGYTNQVDAGAATSVTINGLQLNVTYYFSVVAYDAVGRQSPPSNEIAYTVAPDSLAPVAPTLSVQRVDAGINGATLRLSFQSKSATTYQLQATPDFRHWQTVCTTNCPGDGLVVFYVADMATYPKRFYRLNSMPGGAPTLVIGPPPAGQSAGALCLSFQGSAGRTYDIEATHDFLYWEALWTTNCASDGLVTFELSEIGSYPRRFYRLGQR